MRFDPDTPHDDNLGDDCMCRKCRYASVQFSGQRRHGNSHNSNPKLRPIVQPHNPHLMVERPGGVKVPVRDETGRAVRVSEAGKYARKIKELKERDQAARNHL
jgi:hypothetical protein